MKEENKTFNEYLESCYSTTNKNLNERIKINTKDLQTRIQNQLEFIKLNTVMKEEVFAVKAMLDSLSRDLASTTQCIIKRDDIVSELIDPKINSIKKSLYVEHERLLETEKYLQNLSSSKNSLEIELKRRFQIERQEFYDVYKKIEILSKQVNDMEGQIETENLRKIKQFAINSNLTPFSKRKKIGGDFGVNGSNGSNGGGIKKTLIEGRTAAVTTFSSSSCTTSPGNNEKINDDNDKPYSDDQFHFLAPRKLSLPVLSNNDIDNSTKSPRVLKLSSDSNIDKNFYTENEDEKSIDAQNLECNILKQPDCYTMPLEGGVSSLPRVTSERPQDL